MTKKILCAGGILAASAAFFCAGWWCSIHISDRGTSEPPTGVVVENQIEEAEERQSQDASAISIPAYERLLKAKWVSDLPPSFESVLFKGETADLDSILYSEGMPKDLTRVVLDKITLLSKGYQTIRHGVGENRRHTFNAGTHEGKRLRYLIYPTHFMVFSVFDKAGPPTEIAFALALTGEGIKIVGIRYAEIINAEQDGAGQPATAPESKAEGIEKPKPESEVRPQ